MRTFKNRKILAFVISILALVVMIAGPLLYERDLVLQYMSLAKAYIIGTWQYYVSGIVLSVAGYLIAFIPD